MTGRFVRGRDAAVIKNGYRALRLIIVSSPPLSVRELYKMSAAISRHGSTSIKPMGGHLSCVRRGYSVRPFRWRRSLSSATTPSTQQPIVFSGIQPTGVPHLGNYLGALRQWVKLQDDAKPGSKLLFSIVDLHALTVPQEPTQLKRWRIEAFATLLAVGLDPKRSTIFYQSAVSSRAFCLGEISTRPNDAIS